jgi:hypothetical protein
LWEKREKLEGENPLYQMKLNLLSELYQTAKRIIEDEQRGSENFE